MKREIQLPAVLALGSNLGDREEILRDAIDDIAALRGVTLRKTSGFIETEAVKPDGPDASAPPYLNGVVSIRTTLYPQELLERLNEIEAAHGRVRAERWGDRTLDIDIVAMGPLRVDSETLTVPHPRAFERDFVLRPWLEIEPDATLAGHGRIDALLAAMGSAS